MRASGFPNQRICDSWRVGLKEADHADGHDRGGLGDRAEGVPRLSLAAGRQGPGRRKFLEALHDFTHHTRRVCSRPSSRRWRPRATRRLWCRCSTPRWGPFGIKLRTPAAADFTPAAATNIRSRSVFVPRMGVSLGLTTSTRQDDSRQMISPVRSIFVSQLVPRSAPVCHKLSDRPEAQRGRRSIGTSVGDEPT